MPDYGIKDSKSGKGLLEWKWAEQRLTKARNYFLTTVRPDGRPHVMPIWGLWIGNAFYFSTGKTSIKARNLASNPNCVLCPGDADEAVIVEGNAAKTTSRTILKKFKTAYLKKYDWDVSSMTEPLYVLRPRVVFGQIEETYTESATRWTF
jgi:general stress protein 26